MAKITYFSLLLLLIFCTISIGASGKKLFSDLREKMVTTQIIARGIKDSRVIEAMKKVPRHLFVPEKIRKSITKKTKIILPVHFGGMAANLNEI